MDVFFTLDLIGTAIFAYGGSVAAKQQRFHVLGVFYISLLTAVGGGTVRSILLQTPELFWMKSSAYLVVIGAVVFASYWIRLNTNRLWFYLLDSQSIAVFVALGVSVTLNQGQPLHIAFAMGVLSGIGGGLIRDAITSQPPQALSDPAYPVIMAAAALGSVVAIKLGMPTWTLACLGVLIVVLLTVGINYFRSGKPVAYRRTQPGGFAQSPDSSTERPSTDRDTRYLSAQTAARNPTRYQMRPIGKKRKSGLRAVVQASGVILLSCVVGFYYLNQSIPDATANVTSNTTKPVGAALTATTGNAPTAAEKLPDEKQEYLALLQSIDQSLASRQILEAEQLINDARRSNFADHRLENLITEASNFKAYLLALDSADLALASNDLPSLQETIKQATSLGYNDHRLDTLKVSLANSLERAKIEAANKNLARKSFDLHLASAKHHLELGNIDIAIAEVETAESFEFSDKKLNQLIQQIDAYQLFDTTPLTDAEFEYAAERFKQLERAIKLKNINAISSLTTENSARRSLFSGLFDRYVEINATVSKLATANKVISATLALENMRLPNGNVAYPPSSYGKITLSMQRTRQGWSRINW